MKLSPQGGPSPDEPMFGYEGWDYDTDTGELYHMRYGRWYARSAAVDELGVELDCFLYGQSEEQGGLGKYGHARRAIDLLWNKDPKEKFFVWTPEAEMLIEEACRCHDDEVRDPATNHIVGAGYLGVCGAGSSGKSFPVAAWAWLNYLAAPTITKILVTSTSINAAKQRIWGAVLKLFNKLPARVRKHHKLLLSSHLIKFLDPDPSMADDTTRGIELIAAEPKKDINAVEKLVGRKMYRLMLVGDELSFLSESVNTAFFGNLFRNEWSQYIALSNPVSWLDPFGQFCLPADGIQSVGINTLRWETERGIVIRFDDMQGQNYVTAKADLERAIEGNPEWQKMLDDHRRWKELPAHIRKIMRRRVQAWRPSWEEIERERKLSGENSLAFMSQFRAMFSTNGASDSIYSNADLINYVQDTEKNPVIWGKEGYTKLLAIDLSFSRGGDRTVMMLFHAGLNAEGKRVLEWQDTQILQDDAMNTGKTRTVQICEQIAAYAMKHEVQHRYIAYDSTGAGGPFGDALVQFTSREIYPVNFGGKATERPVSASIRKPSHERYANRVSELWYSGVEVLRGRQFAGLPKDLMAEMANRTYTYAAGNRILVQPKAEIKARTGKSPDLADCLHIALDLCRERLHFASVERGAAVLPRESFYEMLRGRDIVALSSGGMPDYVPLPG